jgi:5-deoxy-glucuronate isomerase
MAAGYLRLAPGQTYCFGSLGQETAVLLLKGSVKFNWDGNDAPCGRPDPFSSMPVCLHIPGGVHASVEAAVESECMVLEAKNLCTFAPRLYRPEDCASSKSGVDELSGTARRDIRTVFDYENAPYSNIVIGEVVNYPGRWSSVPPHHHPQSELYFYRFDRPQGFGACFIGDEAYAVRHLSYAAIPGGLVYPQAAAPGYAMHYVWAIRHLEGNPWTKTRTVAPEHEWLLDPATDILSPKD